MVKFKINRCIEFEVDFEIMAILEGFPVFGGLLKLKRIKAYHWGSYDPDGNLFYWSTKVNSKLEKLYSQYLADQATEEMLDD